MAEKARNEGQGPNPIALSCSNPTNKIGQTNNLVNYLKEEFLI